MHVSDRRVRDPLLAARKTFASLGMTRTRLRNGVLVYLSLPARRLAIVGDEGFTEPPVRSSGRSSGTPWRIASPRTATPTACCRCSSGFNWKHSGFSG